MRMVLVILLIELSKYSITGLFCDTCVYYSGFSSIRENHSLFDKAISYDESCKAIKNSYPNLTLIHSCSHKDNACAFMSLKNNNGKEVTLRKCVALKSSQLMNKCEKYTEQVQQVTSRAAYSKMFNTNDVLEIKVCFCSKHVCGPHSPNLPKLATKNVDTIINASNIVSQHIAELIDQFKRPLNISSKNNQSIEITSSSSFDREKSKSPNFTPTTIATTNIPNNWPTMAGSSTESYISNNSNLNHSTTRHSTFGIVSNTNSTVTKLSVVYNPSNNETMKVSLNETKVQKINDQGITSPLFVLILVPVSAFLLVLFAILAVLAKRIIAYSRFISEFVEHNNIQQ